MKKMFHLSSCSTCQRIIKELDLNGDILLLDIKKEQITEEDLDAMAGMTGGYEALFSRRAMKYKSMGLKDKQLGEQDYRKLILEEYTFLKRPVLVVDEQIFVGNAKRVVAEAKEFLLVEGRK